MLDFSGATACFLTLQGSDIGFLLPRTALTRAEAAASLGVSTSFFDRNIRDELPVVYRGKRRLYPVVGIETWLAKNAAVRPV